MKTTTIIFVTPDDETENLNRDIEMSSHLLNEWPVYTWHTEEATQQEIEWYNEEYGEGEGDA